MPTKKNKKKKGRTKNMFNRSNCDRKSQFSGKKTEVFNQRETIEG